GGTLLSRDDTASTLQAELSRAAVRTLAASDAVQWISPEPPRVPLNNRGRANTRTDQVQAAPYNLTGAGVQVGVWDSGPVYRHTDFGSRLNVMDSGPVDSHATHVAGIVAGDGSRSSALGFPAGQFRGHAPAADLFSYDHAFVPSPMAEHNVAINGFGVDVSQNSWGLPVEEPPAGDCSLYGDYHSWSREYDRIVAGLYTRRIPIVFSAGNEGSKAHCGLMPTPLQGNYSVILAPATAKNVLTVGAIFGDTGGLTTFSSRGPTDDGRLKPDLVAPGHNAAATPQAAIVSTSTSNAYVGTQGTSMAAPAVSGAIALLLQRYRGGCPANTGDPLPSTVKALLLHTARDLANVPSFLDRGPDYASGYGALDIQAAVDLLPFHREDQVGHGQSDTFQITVTPQSNLEVTLVWDDVAAVANASVTLVNDLDIELIDPLGGVHRPWVLDPANPSNPATRGVDRRNVVEQVVIDTVTPAIAGLWTIRVTGANVPSGPQPYSLVTQHLPIPESSCQGGARADAWIMDKDVPLAPVDTGSEPNPDRGEMWASNQIWVRNAADGQTQHQNPEAGQTNHVYARIRNRGGATLNTVRVMVYAASASTALSWPRDWTLIGERTVANLAAGADAVIEPVAWNPPHAGHFCLYVRLLSDQDPMAFAEGPNVFDNTRNNNNIAWRNLNVVDLVSDQGAEMGFQMGNSQDVEERVDLRFEALPDEEGRTLLDLATVDVTIGEDLRRYLARSGIEFVPEGFERTGELTWRMSSPSAAFPPLLVRGRRKFPLHVTIRRVAEEAPSETYTLDVHQNFQPAEGESPAPAGSDTGGVRYEVIVR
ncbi:MAG TPA: S8 family serine peptidase, partial [Thermoanaerobaculia bacterium]|nr:S8 family serine peptidase [Thermoanaerobaculia bacterium]